MAGMANFYPLIEEKPDTENECLAAFAWRVGNRELIL
jgi:hypothetical protein